MSQSWPEGESCPGEIHFRSELVEQEGSEVVTEPVVPVDQHQS
ncbi:hypothetical protein [Streptomyces sp. HUAS ZL42]